MKMSQIKILPHYGNDLVTVETKPEGQKFAIGEEVFIAPICKESMLHFNCDLITNIEYSYGQAYGGGKASDQYSTDIAAWYDECQLMPTNGMSVEDCRSKCLEYFGVSYDEMIKERTEKVKRRNKVLSPNLDKKFDELMERIDALLSK